MVTSASKPPHSPESSQGASDHAAPSARWFVAEGEGWRVLSAEEVLSAFERGDISAEHTLKAGEHAPPKPLRKLTRELVWSARSEMRAEVDVQRDSYLDVVDHAPIPTALSDLGGRLTYVNQAFCDFIGYSQEELIGMTVSELSHPEDLSREVKRGNRVISGHDAGFGFEKRYITKGGELKSGQLSIALLHTSEGVPDQVLAQIVDLSELKTLHAKLSRSKTLSALGELSRHLTHDFKNILMILEGTLDLIQERLEGHLTTEEVALVMQGLSVCKSGERLVMSLLDLRPQDELTLTPLTLASLLRSLQPSLERATSPVPFMLSIDPSLTHTQVNADPVLIERLLLNLCVNARQAIAEAARSKSVTQPQQQEIQVRLRPLISQGDEGAEELEEFKEFKEFEGLVLEVIDTGPGLPKELLERLFDPAVSTRLGRGGHGLGLTAVSAICEQLSAPLSLVSEEGKGTRFCVTLARLPRSPECPS